MTSLSSLRSRRFAARQTEATEQLVTFRLRQEWFALPIQTVQRVVPLGKIYGDPNRTGISLTKYQGLELLVIDVSYRIFKEAAESRQKPLPSERYLAIAHNSNLELFGLPIDSPPTLRRVPQSAFKPLPEAYIAKGNLQSVSSIVTGSEEQPSLFLLSPDQLMAQG